MGTIPSRLLGETLNASAGQLWWRRVFTAPGTSGRRQIVGGDPRRRRFTGSLAQLIRLRDQHCTDPYCTAAIRHVDHIIPYRDHGPTNLGNGRGVCERGNYVRDMPGWTVELVDPGGNETIRTIAITTPTGHTYLSQPPNPP